MSESLHAPAPTVASHDDPPSPGEGGPFTEQQIEQFEEDDGDAGRAIGKMLATFFLYTVDRHVDRRLVDIPPPIGRRAVDDFQRPLPFR